MHSRPIRWKSFWFGVLFFAFLGWASWDSFRWLSYGTFRNRLSLVRAGGRTEFVIWGKGQKTGLELARDRKGYPWTSYSNNLVKQGARHRGIPDYLIATPFLLAWLGWLAWRWSRVDGKRKAPAHC